jgi:kynurenine formamidase
MPTIARPAAVAVAVTSLFASAAAAQEAWHPSRHGAGDTLGAVNNLSPEGVRRAVGLVKLGKVYSLAVPTGPDSPAYGGRSYKVQITPAPGKEPPSGGPDAPTGYDEVVTTSMGIGTQMDGLGHVGVNHRAYNGRTAAQVNTPEGFKQDLSSIPPIVTRGVLIDMARHFGVQQMKPGQVYNRPEIEAAMRAQGVTIRKGDVVLFHTGWQAMAGKDKTAFLAGEPGIGEGGAAWLADQGVVAIGSDTWALEALPAPNPAQPFRVHALLLAKKGVHILENIETAELAKDRATEFLFVLGQPKFVGTVQLVVHPVAIR